MKLIDSSFLLRLLKKNNDVEAYNCAEHILRDKPGVPRDFLTKFIAVISGSLMLTNYGYRNSVNSYKVKIAINNLTPSHKITNVTKEVKKMELLRELRDAPVQFPGKLKRIVPEKIKLRYDEDVKDLIINAMGELQENITIGNRHNGFVDEEYIKTVTAISCLDNSD